MKISGPKKKFQIFLSDLPWMASPKSYYDLRGNQKSKQYVDLDANSRGRESMVILWGFIYLFDFISIWSEIK